MFRVAEARSYGLFSRLTLVAVDDMIGSTGRLSKNSFREFQYNVKKGDRMSFLAPFWRLPRVGDMLGEKDVMLLPAARKFIPALRRSPYWVVLVIAVVAIMISITFSHRSH